MTLGEAIKHAEEVAKEKDKSVELYKAVKATEGLITKCENCAKEHRQLAEWLKELKALREVCVSEAFDLAIKVLEQQPCEDVISRQAVLEQTYNWSKDEFLRVTNPFDYLRKRINDLPLVTPARAKSEWIPVSERVAEFPCLACDIFEQIFIPCGIVVLDNRCYDGKDFAFNVEKFFRGKEVTLYGGKRLYEKPKEIVAWMPLPEPYKAESEG